VIPFYEALPQGAMHDPATPATLRVYLGGKRDALRPLRDGDQLVSVQGQPVGSLAEFLSGLQSAEGPLRLGLLRGEQTLDWSAPEGFSGKLIPAQQEALIGITTDSKRITRYPDPITQLSEHLNLTWVTLKSLFHPKSDIQVKHMAGAIEISRTVYTLSNIDWRLVLSFAVLLNINLAIMNLLPIPVLDGGHITLALISRLRGSPPPPNLVMSVQSVFMILLLGLMAYILFNDSRRWLGETEQQADYERSRVYQIPYVPPAPPAAAPRDAAQTEGGD
jgi:regulator of sigma E protease